MTNRSGSQTKLLAAALALSACGGSQKTTSNTAIDEKNSERSGEGKPGDEAEAHQASAPPGLGMRHIPTEADTKAHRLAA